MAEAAAAAAACRECLSCSVCGELFRDPHTLPCLHRFCGACLGKGESCPECKLPYFAGQRVRSGPALRNLVVAFKTYEAEIALQQAEAAADSEAPAADEQEELERQLVGPALPPPVGARARAPVAEASVLARAPRRRLPSGGSERIGSSSSRRRAPPAPPAP